MNVHLRNLLMTVTVAALCCRTAVIAAPDDVEAVPKKAQNQNQFFMNDANLEANLFQPHGNAVQAKSVMESRLRLQIDEIKRVCSLNEQQELKLKLAGGADMKRLFEEAEVIRKKYKKSNHDQEAWNNIWQQIHPLQMKMSNGLFGEGSFFQMTLQKTLSESQQSDYDKVVQERRRFRYLATIESVLTNMENSVPLRHSQHETIVKLLYEETPPPVSFGQYDQYLVMYYITTFPEGKIKSVLEERQWALMQPQLNQARGMKQFLIQNGLIPKEKDEVKVLKAKGRRKVAQTDAPADASQPENQTEKQP